jgi:hypothetical protein
MSDAVNMKRLRLSLEPEPECEIVCRVSKGYIIRSSNKKILGKFLI